jgi:predicted Rossmann fold nucleotide-binding protein DprA/Smf involved in DNA uptake
MAAASSVGTYLDVAQSTKRAPDVAVAESGTEDLTTHAAKALDAISQGATTLDAIATKTQLGVGDAVNALSYLQRAELVSLANDEQGLRASLTPAAVAALGTQ